ncbi:MAG: AAA family ATPase [Deltaproteobacteria bacterium]|nr:AAA family ATPase [Deltaproteobacteria bacterium]
MYKDFFGFRERPFQLVPNPAYLFLSRSHEEALAHLAYAISQGDGFVEITGEVGTGKTTLCRAFLENLDRTTEAAYIFNPKLDSIQLLKSINDEFGITSEGENTKELIDVLNAFLLKVKGEGKRAILLIDEAQNLSKEVLEQLRLLSNLETTTSKLLQIILVGQPELGEMLDSYDLRQLGQRITLSCHIQPLTAKETRDYVRHRIQVASQKPGASFTRGAVRTIHRYSGGIPRLINIACDRALLTAFGLDQRRISAGIARAAVRELSARGEVKRIGLGQTGWSPYLLGTLCVALIVFALYDRGYLSIEYSDGKGKQSPGGVALQKRPDARRIPETALAPAVQPAKEEEGDRTQSPPAPKEAKVQGIAQTQPAPAEKGAEGERQMIAEHGPAPGRLRDTGPALEKAEVGGKGLADFLQDTEGPAARSGALMAVLRLWNTGSGINRYLENMEDDQAFFRLAAKHNGLSIHQIANREFEIIRKLNLPAILKCYLPQGLSPRYLTLTRMDEEDTLTLAGGGGNHVVVVSWEDLRPYWSGVAYIPWKNFLDYEGIIPLNAPRDSVITLKMFMQDIGFENIEITPAYDESTRKAIMMVQERHGIRADGIVGPLTKIVLYNEKSALNIPHIRPES